MYLLKVHSASPFCEPSAILFHLSLCGCCPTSHQHTRFCLLRASCHMPPNLYHPLLISYSDHHSKCGIWLPKQLLRARWWNPEAWEGSPIRGLRELEVNSLSFPSTNKMCFSLSCVFLVFTHQKCPTWSNHYTCQATFLDVKQIINQWPPWKCSTFLLPLLLVLTALFLTLATTEWHLPVKLEHFLLGSVFPGTRIRHEFFCVTMGATLSFQ